MTIEEAYNRIDAIIAKHEIDDEYVTIINSEDYDALRIARKTLEQEPSEDVAKECYEDLCRYFGDAKDILKNREDFKAWLDRIKWHIHKAEELSAENNDLRDQLAMRDRFQKQEPMREFTEEEAKAYSKALDKMYKPTGFNVFDEYGNYKYPSDVELTEPNTATSMPCDNTISRQAVNTLIDELARAISDERCCISRGRSTATIMRDILHLPPVAPQQKTGHWIKKEDDTCWWYACSECEQEPLKNRWNDDDVLSTFCPNCGAKMIEPQ